MSNSIQSVDLAGLSPVEKMELADVLYDSAVQEMEALMSPLTEPQRREVERRMADADAHPSLAEPWESVRDELMRRTG